MMESMHGVNDEDLASPPRPAADHRARGEDVSRLLQDMIDPQESTRSFPQSTLDALRVHTLNEEILSLRRALRDEQHEKTVIRELTEKSDKELAKLIQCERERAEQHALQYQLLLEDYTFLLEQYETLNARKEEETKDIVKHANDTQVRCAELEEENDKLLNDLVHCKVEFANVSMLVDDLRAEKKDLQRALVHFQALVDSGELVMRRSDAAPRERDKEREGFDPFSAAPIKPVLVHVQRSHTTPCVQDDGDDAHTALADSATENALPGLQIVAREFLLDEDATTCEEIVFV